MSQREKQLLGFRPLHPCVRYFCQLCGDEVSADKAISRNGRADIMAQDEAHLFCPVCAPEIDRICNLLAGEEQRISRQQESDRETQLKAVAEAELGALREKRQHDGGGPSAPPSDERTSPRSPRRRAPKRTGMIPNPSNA